MIGYLRLLLILFVGCLIAQPVSASSVYKSHVEVELISDVTTIKPDETFWIGLRMTMDEGWHTYWRNSGDSGLATTIDWSMPVEYGAGDIHWPYPKRFDYESGLTGYGYDGEVVLLTQFWPPETREISPDLEFSAQVRWLACNEICVPGVAYLSITLNQDGQSAEVSEEVIDMIARAKASWPVISDDWQVNTTTDEENFIIQIKPHSLEAAKHSGLEFFPYRNDVINHSADQVFTIILDGYQLTVDKAVLLDEDLERLQGILVSQEGWNAKGQHALFINGKLN